tara:strand:- start:760 stop:1107 length:348 start_codon:yes stop_codon:yes gene_type:complete
MKKITEKQATHNPTLEQPVGSNSQLKQMIVDYVGINSEEYIRDDEVTVEMIVELMSREFPEFLMVVAEENWVRGYHQALTDVDYGRRSEEGISDKEWVEGYKEHLSRLESSSKDD